MTNITGDGTSPTAGIPITKGTYLLSASGTFSASNVITPYHCLDGTNFQTFTFNGSALSFTGPDAYIIPMGQCQMEYITSGSDSTTSVFMKGSPVSSVGGGQSSF